MAWTNVSLWWQVHAALCYSYLYSSYHGIGLLPDCSRKADGHYEYPSRPCDAYYRCRGGVASAVKCPSYTSFNKDTGMCMAGKFSIIIYIKTRCLWANA